MSFFLQIVNTLICALVSFHCYVFRFDLLRLIFAVDVNFRTRPLRCMKKLLQSNSTSVPRNAMMDKQLDELRIANFRQVIGIAQHVVVVSACFLLLCTSRGQFNGLSVVVSLVVTTFVCYFVCFWFSSDGVSLTVRRMHGAYYCVMAIWMVRMCCATDSTYLVMMGPLRSLYRMTTGFVLLDWQLSGCWNALASFLVVWRYLHYTPMPLLDSFIFILTEFLVLLWLTIVLYIGEKWTETRIEATFEVRSWKIAHRAVRKLLSVLCDAEVHLGPDLRVINPSQKIAHLLGNGVLDAAGREFLHCVVDFDRGRFQEFVSASSSPYSGARRDNTGVVDDTYENDDETGPPASIQLNLCDAAGNCFPVELFHVGLPDLNSNLRAGHLIGIREMGAIVKLHEGSSAVRTAGVAEVIASYPASPASSTRIPLQSSMELPQLGMDGERLQPSRKEGKDGVDMGSEILDARSDSGSATGSGSSLTSSLPPRVIRTDLPEVSEISVQFDALSSRMIVRQLVLSFADPSATIAGGTCNAGERPGAASTNNTKTILQLPELADWVLQETWEGFRAWAQVHINAMFSGKDVDGLYAGMLRLRLPMGSTSTTGEEMFLEAENVSLELLDDQESDGSSDSADEEGALLAVVTLRKIQQVNVSGIRRRKSGRNRRARRQAYGDRSMMEKLPAIEEQLPAAEEQLSASGGKNSEKSKCSSPACTVDSKGNQQLPDTGEKGSAASACGEKGSDRASIGSKSSGEKRSGSCKGSG